MKQPELGQRILELRKSRGLTQEELVEKCKINVRTIQRIEAGEVTPRSFTIKTILEALEVDSSYIFQNQTHQQEAQFSSREINKLNISWIAGIFFIVFSVVGLIGEFYFWDEGPSMDQLIYRVPYNLLYLLILVFFIRGYKTLGDYFKNSSLVNGVYAYFLIEVIITFLNIGTSVLETDQFISAFAVGIPATLLYGVAELILGLGIIKLKSHLGSFANFLGILKIVNGGMLLSVVLSPIALFLAVPILILEVVFLFNMATNSKFHHS